jgi:hypothetical protein
METESQAVLNTLTEHNFNDALKKIVYVLGTVYMCGRGLLRGLWWPVGPKLIFDQMAAQVPEIMDKIL